MATMPDYDALFREYAAVYNRSLGDKVDAKAIRGFFAEAFLAAGVNGEVNAGTNDKDFETTLHQAYGFYKSIGTRSLQVNKVEPKPLFDGHDVVRVFYTAKYRKPHGEDLAIPFTVVYLLQRREGGPKIFAFIAGDEMALYKQHGLVDDHGQPARAA